MLKSILAPLSLKMIHVFYFLFYLKDVHVAKYHIYYRFSRKISCLSNFLGFSSCIQHSFSTSRAYFFRRIENLWRKYYCYDEFFGHIMIECGLASSILQLICLLIGPPGGEGRAHRACHLPLGGFISRSNNCRMDEAK